MNFTTTIFACLLLLTACNVSPCQFDLKNDSIAIVDQIKLKPCSVCGAKAYLHKAINDIEHPSWAVDCTAYDKECCKHERVGRKWHSSIKEAIQAWNTYEQNEIGN